jgi:hypothetical protein
MRTRLARCQTASHLAGVRPTASAPLQRPPPLPSYAAAGPTHSLLFIHARRAAELNTVPVYAQSISLPAVNT